MYAFGQPLSPQGVLHTRFGIGNIAVLQLIVCNMDTLNERTKHGDNITCSVVNIEPH